jgi:colanic acid biosynthesis glycosyl transferase WcaI
MRVLLLTQWFEPESALKGLAFARALKNEGIDVEVITGFPNYPGGRVYPGYRVKLFQREVSEGIPVLRVALFPSHDASAFRRFVNYSSFALSAAILGAVLTRRPDVIYAYHPPLTVGVAAVALGAIKRAPFVYDIQDLWPDTLAATGMVNNRSLLRLVDKVATSIYRRAACLVVQSPGFKRILRSRGVPERKIDVIYNWCDEEQLHIEHDVRLAEELHVGKDFTVVFAGTMGKAQGLEAVIGAAALLQPTGNVQFIFVGGGVETEHLTVLAAEMDLGNVHFLPRMPMAEIGRVLGAADVLLVHLRDDPLFEVTIPAKTQAYLCVGKPVLMAVRGDAADLIAESRGGVSCEPEDAVGLAETISELSELPSEELKSMGQRGAAYYWRTLSLEVGTRRFVDVFRKVTRGQPPRRASRSPYGR